MEIYELQNQIDRWMLYNFGSKNSHGPSHWPLLAIVEEVSEIVESFDSNQYTKDVKDAIGDSMIACIGYCCANEWDAQELWNTRILLEYKVHTHLVETLEDITIIMGRLCRAHLKKEQQIRGDFNEHNRKGRIAIQRIMYWLEQTHRELKLKPSFMNNLEHVWKEVRIRNFEIDPMNGKREPLEWND